MPQTTTLRRKSAPKGRGGCSTCKLRHVRCDGQKPRCIPCQKSSRQCDHSSDLDPEQLKVVLWQRNDSTLPRISSNPGHTSDEVRAFDFFRTKVATNLGGFFDSRFWARDVLQAAQHEPSVRHAIVALASLSETILEATLISINTPRAPEAFAIRQYTKAISELIQKLQDSNESSSEVVLMTCAIFICFEMFHNHHEAALRQMSSGIYVFYDWHSKQRRQAQLSSPRSLGKPSELAIQLQHIFGRLMIQTILFIDTRPSEWQFATPAFTPTRPSIPSVFRSIDEARECLDSCLCSLYHEALISKLGGLEIHEVRGGPLSQLNSGPIQQWRLPFESFMRNQRARLSSREQQAAIILEVQQITGSILVYASAFSQETIFDSFEHSFSQIVDLASRLLTGQGEFPQNSKLLCPAFDMGILPHLYFVASRCRHPSIRREALHLLRNGPSQEGIWHSDMLSNIAERIMGIEEIDCAGALSSVDIPATARVSVLNAKISSAQRTVVLHCCQPKFGESGSMHVLHELVVY